MSANKFLSHLQVLPEDDANRQLALGFLLHPALNQHKIQLLRAARGWKRVLDYFENEYVRDLTNNAQRNLLLLIDFDSDPKRLELVKEKIPRHLENRVFVLGVWSEPEDLRAAFGNYEAIGTRLANGCFSTSDPIWEHQLLKHNAKERERLWEQLGSVVLRSE